MNLIAEEGQGSLNAAFAFGEARAYLGGTKDFVIAEVILLAKKLRDTLQFGLARRVAARGRADARSMIDDEYQLLRLEVTCTYKDLELPPEEALPNALRLLQEYLESQPQASSLAQTFDSEILSLAGAVHKRWWEYDQRQSRLEEALTYYQRAFGRVSANSGDPSVEDGYPAINAAFILDRLASLELAALGRNSPPDSPPLVRLRDAADLRADVATALRPRLREASNEYWVYATAAEAFIGLEKYAEASEALRSAIAQPHAEWQLESTSRQLADLSRLHEVLRGGTTAAMPSPVSAAERPGVEGAWAAVRAGLGSEWTAGVTTSFAGKLGIALSGGGFRAALYHIGVLARLAELDLLRRIEVLSCVSGGSMIGARYYLEVRRLLQAKTDADISAEDYRDIVHRIEVDFLAGVQHDLRNHLLADVALSWRALFSPSYSRTHGLGRLIERTLLAGALPPVGTTGRPVLADLFISALYVAPLTKRKAEREDGTSRVGVEQSPERVRDENDPSVAEAEPRADTHDLAFNPRLQNWRRRAKVPILIVNATTLNTGHPWQFTASWMGEPASAYDARTSATPRLVQVRYADAPAAFRAVRLGEAVAASAAVPGLFDPLPMDGLYAGDLGVRLIDGGVHDNQGIGGLLDQGCTVLLVSDASGQLTVGDLPAGDPYNVSKRANDVLMARVRETQVHLLKRMCDAGIVRAVVHTHLRLDLELPAVPPLEGIRPGADGDNGDPAATSYSPSADPSAGRALTRYGIRRNVALQLAQIRTDLDAFHDFEADALMCAGYRATSTVLLETPAATQAATDAGQDGWRFLGIEPLLTGDGTPDDVMTDVLACLAVSRRIFGKTLNPGKSSKPWLAALVLSSVAVAGGAFVGPEAAARWTGRTLLAALGVTLLWSLFIAVVGRVQGGPLHRKSWWIRWSGLSGIFFWPIPLWAATEGRRTYLRLGARGRWVGRLH